MDNAKLMAARLVWDGGDEVRIPPSMGTPREDQMQGTAAERLTELAGRICFDSLGKGRPSFTQEVVTGADPHTGEQLLSTVEGYHDHIRAVGHGSVLEHFNFTVQIEAKQFDAGHVIDLLNRPGLWTRIGVGPTTGSALIELTLNLRTAVEWEVYMGNNPSPGALELHGSIAAATRELAPHIAIDRGPEFEGPYRLVEPDCDEQAWVSLYMAGSRGFSHEQVRHGDWTAISQRSTRYVDESESPWVEHPLVTLWKIEQTDSAALHETPVEDAARAQYDACVKTLEPWLISKGVDKGTARKQARGAARGYLGNALHTEMIFSASVAQWKHMLRQRCSIFADAEIRLIHNDVLRELKSCRYAESFAGMELVPSPDGIGMVLSE